MSDYHEIFEKMPDGVLLHEPGGGAIVETNEQFCSMLGYSREELLELDFDAIHLDEPPYTAERAEELVRQAAREEPLHFEWVTKTKSGAPLPVEVHLRETTIDGDVRVLAVVRDITERQRRQQELTLQNHRLEKFASIVSHDLRNPLSVAQGRLELAREECDSEHLDAVSRAHERMESLIRDLLVLAREGSEAMTVDSVELSTHAKLSWANVQSGDAALVVDDDQRSIRADPGRLEQLFENLFRNSVEHGGDVSVTVGLVEDGFYVEDDGPGIPQHIVQEVFEAGYSSVEDGTGIGLSIVMEIVTAHGWEIRVTESERGGARFEVTGVEFVS
ncbi:PAS domain S-box protein [Haloferax sp. MBLA0076]|uniref:histidine kinase n=1 Tax=Haloferax litoreum TaxID=2666140 RepID=A0A6A8GGM9_9EURY|nr:MULTISPECIES: PAS domain-containing sensor histidine kinase [Haloferax]KAB1193781.1 PAS domain S-box protein [Haloferax sp. CBA1148]MRX22318.1 PAS domain S-box protein [Haloferax litoreum]